LEEREDEKKKRKKGYNGRERRGSHTIFRFRGGVVERGDGSRGERRGGGGGGGGAFSEGRHKLPILLRKKVIDEPEKKGNEK